MSKEKENWKTILCSVKTGSSQNIKRNKALSKHIASETVAKLASSSNTKLVKKSKNVDHQALL